MYELIELTEKMSQAGKCPWGIYGQDGVLYAVRRDKKEAMKILYKANKLDNGSGE